MQPGASVPALLPLLPPPVHPVVAGPGKGRVPHVQSPRREVNLPPAHAGQGDAATGVRGRPGVCVCAREKESIWSRHTARVDVHRTSTSEMCRFVFVKSIASPFWSIVRLLSEGQSVSLVFETDFPGYVDICVPARFAGEDGCNRCCFSGTGVQKMKYCCVCRSSRIWGIYCFQNPLRRCFGFAENHSMTFHSWLNFCCSVG